MEIDFRTVDEFNNEVKLHKKFSEDGSDGLNIYSLYQEFINFLKASDFGENAINMIQLIENDDNYNKYALKDKDEEFKAAFRTLCKALEMEFVLNEDEKFSVNKDKNGENIVYHNNNGTLEYYDDRGDLFVALRNVAVNIFQNTYFRNADYIYK